ncbi:YjgF [Acrasis kona]|uniref:2-iminobutanoate/2-iminopropanoate deaminase n=1 Tax=Acrasis kona TaxID=1008807 RepID=A0AAW2YMA2_9EUKA
MNKAIIFTALTVIGFAVAHERSLATLIGDDVTRVVGIPSGAPPTNDGYAYSQLSYNNDFLWIAGQNGYDSCGRLVDLDEGGNIWTRAYIAFLSIKATMECFNMPITQIPSTTVYLSPLPVTNASTTPADINRILLEWRSQVNVIQRLPEFWGNSTLPARAVVGAQWLSRGDAVEIEPKAVPRTNTLRRTCLDTRVSPPSAQILLRWTKQGIKPTTAIPLLRLGDNQC